MMSGNATHFVAITVRYQNGEMVVLEFRPFNNQAFRDHVSRIHRRNIIRQIGAPFVRDGLRIAKSK
jgi:hypothetical protein